MLLLIDIGENRKLEYKRNRRFNIFIVYMRKNIDNFLIARFLFVFVLIHNKWLCFFVTARFCVCCVFFLHIICFCVNKAQKHRNNNIMESHSTVWAKLVGGCGKLQKYTFRAPFFIDHMCMHIWPCGFKTLDISLAKVI